MEQVQFFFSSLEPKDWITLLASISALIFSLLTFRQKTGEGQLSLRKQLTELLEKLSSLNTEISKYRNAQSKKDEYPPNYIGLMNDQRRLLVRQADFVSSKIPKLTATYECLVIAGAFDGVDQTELAEKYFELAISTEQAVEKGIAVRGYARYLFNNGHIDSAREQYMRCLICFQGDSDRLISYRSDTYFRWSQQEKDWENFEVEMELLKKAYDEVANFASPYRRKIEKARIALLIKKDNSKGPSQDDPEDA